MKPKTKSIGTGGVGIFKDDELEPRPTPKEVRALVKAVRHHRATLRPITVRRKKLMGYWLVSGWLEPEAARILTKKDGNGVEAIILEDDTPEQSAKGAKP